MTNKQITIRMPAEKLKLWLRALRLKKNAKRQGGGALYSKINGDTSAGYCCLGVAQQVISGGIECATSSHGVRHARSFPSNSWLEEQGIQFFDSFGSKTTDPYLPMFDCCASTANDELGKTFLEIADAIEDCAEGY